MRPSRFLFVALPCLVIATACSSLNVGGPSADAGADGPKENTAAPVDALDDPTHPGIGACSSAFTKSEIEDALELARDFRQSCHELVVCGGLAAKASLSIESIFLNLALGKATGNGDFTYLGQGKYALSSTVTGTSMELQFALGFDTTFGKRGDPIPFDLFAVDSYFKGVQASASAYVNPRGESGYKIGIAFTGVAQGAELLGLGPSPASPLKLDAGEISSALGKVLVSSRIHVDDQQGPHGHFVYDLTSDPQPMGPMAGGEPLPMKLASVAGDRTDNGQKLTVTGWNIAYLNTSASGFMNGTIAFDVTPGSGAKLFPYGVTFVYPNRKTPDVSLSCK